MRALRVGDKVKHAVEEGAPTGRVEKVGLVDVISGQEAVLVQWDDGFDDTLDNGYRVPYPEYELDLEDPNG